MITPETYKTDQKKMAGSTLIYAGDSIEQIREIVENDIYYKSNVVSGLLSYEYIHVETKKANLKCPLFIQWDKENLTIYPFVSAKPL